MTKSKLTIAQAFQHSQDEIDINKDKEGFKINRNTYNKNQTSNTLKHPLSLSTEIEIYIIYLSN